MYTPISIYKADPERVKAYYEALIEADTLKYRYSDVKDPSWKDIMQCFKTKGDGMFLVEDNTGLIVGEFALEEYSGKASQVHFSSLPELTFPETLKMLDEVADTVLTKWKDKDGLPFLHTLVGLTPVSNRAACITVLKSGYKKIGIIPRACLIARHGFYDDAMISIREA